MANETKNSMSHNPSISVQDASEEENKQIAFEFPPDLSGRMGPSISKTEEDDDEVEKTFSPSKYFGKRPSFEYKNLKKIERASHRAHSAIPKNRAASEKSPSNRTNENEESASQDCFENPMENSKVHFSEKVIGISDEETNEVLASVGVSVSPDVVVTKQGKKPKKSILKKTHLSEEITLERIFNKDVNQSLIEKINQESGKEGRHFSEKIGKCFAEHWKSLTQEDAISFLQVALFPNFYLLLIDQGVYPENLLFIFKDGIEFNILLGIINTLKNGFER